MPPVVVMTANIKCAMGNAPSPLMVLPVPPVMAGNMPVGTIKDMVPFMNILPFGMCMSPANPMFIAATAAALGVPTPVPCIPMPAAPWLPGKPTVLKGAPVIASSSLTMCAWAGPITVVAPGQFKVMV